MKTRTFISLSIVAIALGVVAGCTPKTDENAPNTGPTGEKPKATASGADDMVKGSGKKFEGKDFKITMIAKSNNNPVFPSSRKGAEDAAKELSTKLGVNITIDWRTPNEENAEQQSNAVKDAMNQKVNCVLISCSDAAKVTTQINEAVDAGVPVMTFDSDAADSKRFAFYGVDDIETGQQTMAELAKLTGEKGNVAILGGSQNAPNLQKRIQGAKDELKKHPNMKLVDVFPNKETPQDAAQAVIQAMKANPTIDSWCMIGGWPLFSPSLLDLDPAKVKIVSVDCLPAQFAYIDKGIAPILLAQQTYLWGYESVKIIAQNLIEGKDVKKFNKMELKKIEKSNLKEWAKQLKDWGFEGIEAKYLN